MRRPLFEWSKNMEIEKVIENMSLEDKIALGSGKDFWHTKEMEQYGIPSMMMADGPHGLRKQEDTADMLGVNQSVPATSFPTAVTSACSWDRELLKLEGEAIGKEALANGVGVVLGPGANIKRNPLCGRNFEYFSEDPYLTGELAAAFIQGAESTGSGTSLKHFALNNQEHKRFNSDSIVDERAMREIYLTGFEAAVKKGKPSTVMCAYNKINGEHCSDNRELLTDILREEWGFDGMVVTDWGAMSDRIKGFQAGCDLCMPGGASFMEKEAARAVQNGRLDEELINASAERILKVVCHGQKAIQDAKAVDMEAHDTLAERIAAESAVLLKNEGNILPLSKEEETVFVGAMAKEIRYQGAGSSHINPWKLTSVTDACPEVPFVQGCLSDGSTTEELLKEVRDAAAKANKVVVFAGLTPKYESEGFDRETMQMPEGHLRMIEAAAEVNENVIVVLMCGSVIELPWIKKVKGLLYMGLPGEAAGRAIKELLFGAVTPSGKLAESWIIKKEDCICDSYYSGSIKDAQYRESVFVGYRYYTSAKIPVRFPFGFGLSYTNFSYSDLKIKGNQVSCKVTNIGDVSGKEIVQLYIEPADSKIYRPVRELKGFEKVELAPGESRIVSFTLTDRSFAIWDGEWKISEGIYHICIGKNCEEIVLTAKIQKDGLKTEEFSNRLLHAPQWYYELKGIPTQEDFEALLGRKIVEEPLKKGKFTMDNTVMEMKDYSFIMKIMYKAVEATVAKGFGGKVDYNNPEFRMMMCSAADASLTGMKISGGMNNYVLEGMLEIANGHLLNGILKMLGIL